MKNTPMGPPNSYTIALSTSASFFFDSAVGTVEREVEVLV